MSVPPTDKIDEVPDNVWEVLSQDFLNQEIVCGLDIGVTNMLYWLWLDLSQIQLYYVDLGVITVVEVGSTTSTWNLCDLFSK